MILSTVAAPSSISSPAGRLLGATGLWLRGLLRLLLLAMIGLAASMSWAQTAPKATGGAVEPIDRAAALQFLSTYKLGAGDVVTIRVFGEDDLSREKIRLTDSGTLFLPSVGEVVALGMTLGELEKLAVDKLKGRILINPQVSVFVDEYRPFFINGMVDRPGAYPFQPGLTVRKAAALSGGFKERASLSKIFLIRAKDPTQKAVNVDLNATVLPGDIVTVEESFF